jgi:acetylglutamate kinase
MITVVKIGGNVVDDPQSLQDFLRQFENIPGKKILVHGGGKIATSLASKLGIPTQMIDGRRVTDQASLEIAVMTYAGKINKEITAMLNGMNCRAMGLCGADAGLMRATKRSPVPVDFGFVGNLTAEGVNAGLLQLLLDAGITPVIAPLTHDGKGQLLNTNADTIAGCIASALATTAAVQLLFCFEKKGVLSNPDDEDKPLLLLDKSSMQQLAENGTISRGMLPKLNAGFYAREKGVKNVRIGFSGELHGMISQETACTELQ